MDWFLEAFRRYRDFSGRARRKEFWMFYLFSLLSGIVVGVVAAIGAALLNAVGNSAISIIVVVVFSLLCAIFGIWMLVAYLAVGVRRLHDTGRTGWWWLITLVPFAGNIVLIVLWAFDGQLGPNRFGPDPKNRPAVVYAAAASATSAGGATAIVCARCGTKYPDEAAAFCASCGVPRNA